MAKKLSAALGIDIGSQKIKIAEVKLSGKEPVITALGLIDTPEGAVDHTGVYDVDNIAALIKSALPAIGASAGHIVFSVAGQQSVLVRTLEVPKMNPTELKEHMQWEITRNIPFAESTVQSDFRAFPVDDPAATNMDVVMAISPQTAVDTLVAIARKVGKPIGAIDVEPLAISRVLVQGHMNELANQVLCVIEIGHKTMSINMYLNGKLLMPRQVPLGGEMFTRAVSENMAMQLEDAERTKIEKGSIPASASAGGFNATQNFAAFNPYGDDPSSFNPALAIPGLSPAPAAPATTQAFNPFEGETPSPAADMSNFVPFNAGAPIDDTPDTPSMDPAPELEPMPVEDFTPAEPIDVPAPAPVAPVPADDAESMQIFNAMSQIVEEFIAEVRRSVDYFQSKGTDVNKILLCGGAGRLPGLPLRSCPHRRGPAHRHRRAGDFPLSEASALMI